MPHLFCQNLGRNVQIISDEPRHRIERIKNRTKVSQAQMGAQFFHIILYSQKLNNLYMQKIVTHVLPILELPCLF